MTSEVLAAQEEVATTNVLEAADLVKSYPASRKGGSRIQAVRGVSLTIPAGKTVGIVGESGCGKSTLAKMLVGLEEPSGGTVSVDGQRVDSLPPKQRTELMRQVQMVFQSPFTALDPRMSVRQIIREPLDITREGRSRAVREQRVKELMAAVGLPEYLTDRRPRELSGGQQQRVGLARALASGSDVVICDEPVSALDVSVQAQVINLLRDLQDELGVAYVFIAHDLNVVASVSDYIAVMYLGRIVEYGTVAEVYDFPRHPYTKALLSSAPTPEPDTAAQNTRIILQGDLPSPANVPSGCAFRTRCWKAVEKCATEDPHLLPREGGKQEVACFYPE